MHKTGLPRTTAVIATAAVTAVTLAGLAAAATPAAASPANEAEFVALINAERAHAGLRPLAVAADLTGLARSWSEHMADTSMLAHNPALTPAATHAQSIGENIGYGPTVASLDQAFYASLHHRENEL
ncbi:MAG TPA: CAP domain-containing protein, partial [Mycobacteriales bacterium]|nr:CAP domain-containing protein [Mycobacteriales bacterium]